jgi:hypothetical protein
MSTNFFDKMQYILHFTLKFGRNGLAIWLLGKFYEKRIKFFGVVPGFNGRERRHIYGTLNDQELQNFQLGHARAEIRIKDVRLASAAS